MTKEQIKAIKDEEQKCFDTYKYLKEVLGDRHDLTNDAYSKWIQMRTVLSILNLTK